MPNIHTYTIGAYTPYYDAKQLAEFSVVGGKNFMPTVSGYKSAFGSDVLSDRSVDTKLLLNAQIFSLAEQVLVLCNRYGIMQYDPSSEGWYYLVRSSSELSVSYPWSVAYVGGDWFFCKQGFGVWRYRLDERSGMFVSENVPSNPVSVCSSGGRLVILGSSTYAWSAIGDGTDLETSLETGAGFQALSLIGGKPLAVKSNTIGFLVYTTAGIVRVESIDTPNPFNHKVLTADDYAPVSPWAICEVGTGSHVFLAKSGLYATSGDYPEILEKEFSKWLTGTTLKYLLQSRYDLPLALSYDANRRWLVLSYAEYAIDASPYSVAYALDIELAKWGRLDQNHYFIDSAYIPDEKNRGYRTLIATTDGAIRIVNKDYGITELANANYKNNYPVCYSQSYKVYSDSATSVNVFTSGARLDTYNWASLGASVGVLGMYDYILAYKSGDIDLNQPNSFVGSYYTRYGYDEVVDMASSKEPISVDQANVPDGIIIDMSNFETTLPMAVFTACATSDSTIDIFSEVHVSGPLVNLDSQLEIGLYHIPDFDDLQCATVMTGFAQFHEQTLGDSEFIDMMQVPDSRIDMELVPDDYIDMGIGFLSSPNYAATLISSSDGHGNRDLHTYDIEPYSIVGDRFNYNSYSTGLYHGFKIRTTEPGGYYHLKQIQVNIIQGGLVYDGAQTVRWSR